MEIENVKNFFNITPKDNAKEGCELKCAKCRKWASHKQWEESSVYCEICDEHLAIKCPHCEECYDHTYNTGFECRMPR